MAASGLVPPAAPRALLNSGQKRHSPWRFHGGLKRQRSLAFPETLASSAFLACHVSRVATRHASAFLGLAAMPRVVAFLKGSDCEILFCRVHFVPFFV